MNLALRGKQCLLSVMLLTGISWINHAAAAELMTKQYGSCLEKAGGVTAAMHECISAETKVHDVKLNANYKALSAKLPPERRAALLEAQRAWLKYRDANCRFYADPEGGTMAGVEASDCFLRMTADRAKEIAELTR